MNVAISESGSVMLNKSYLVYGYAVFSRDGIAKALRSRSEKFSLKCSCSKGCMHEQPGRKNKSGSIRVGCTLIPKKTVAIIRKWANAK